MAEQHVDRATAAVLAACALGAASCCGGGPKDTQTGPPPAAHIQKGDPAGRALVVLYSRTGATEAVARQIARRLDADIVPIAAPRYPPGYCGQRRASSDAWDERRRTPILHHAVDPSRYALIVLCAPIWWYRPAVPLWTFVEDHRFGGAKRKPVVLCSTFNSRFKDKHIARLRRLVEARGGRWLEHIYVRRGRVVWQKGPEEVRDAIRALLDAREATWRGLLTRL